MTTGKPVLKGDAIALLLSLVQAMAIADEINKDEFKAVRLGEEGENDDDKATLAPIPGSSGLQKLNEPKSPEAPPKSNEEASKPAKLDSSIVCRIHFCMTVFWQTDSVHLQT